LGRIRPTAPQRVRYTASYTTRCRKTRLRDATKFPRDDGPSTRYA